VTQYLKYPALTNQDVYSLFAAKADQPRHLTNSGRIPVADSTP
jgi:hypothetical protein